MALMIGSGIRAVAPGLFASMFALGVRNQILAGHFVWVILVLLAIGLSVSIRWLPEKADGMLKAIVVEEDERD